MNVAALCSGTVAVYYYIPVGCTLIDGGNARPIQIISAYPPSQVAGGSFQATGLAAGCILGICSGINADRTVKKKAYTDGVCVGTYFESWYGSYSYNSIVSVEVRWFATTPSTYGGYWRVYVNGVHVSSRSCPWFQGLTDYGIESAYQGNYQVSQTMNVESLLRRRDSAGNDYLLTEGTVQNPHYPNCYIVFSVGGFGPILNGAGTC